MFFNSEGKNNMVYEQYKNKNVLVTGGCGFIGSHLVEKLVELGAHVTILDDLSTGNLENIIAVKDFVTFIKGDITNLQTCILATQGQEIIFHLAAFISVAKSVADPVTCHTINVTGTQHMLEAARINNVQKFVTSSSAATYGTSEHINVETNKLHPESPYGMSKVINELYCQQYSLLYNLQTVCLRYFNVYGKRQDPHGPYAGAMAAFVHRLENNLPIIIFGNGLQTRDFVPVAKVVDANIRCAMLNKELMDGQAFNIASGESISILNLAYKLKAQYPNYTESITFGPARPGDPKCCAADCTKYNTLVLQKSTDDFVVQPQPLQAETSTQGG